MSTHTRPIAPNSQRSRPYTSWSSVSGGASIGSSREKVGGTATRVTGTRRGAPLALAPELDHPHAKLIETTPPVLSRPPARLPWLLFLAAVALGWNLDGYRLLDPDEGRNAELAREMAQTNDYLVPHLDGLPYLDKPVAYFAAAAALMEVLGPTEAAARLPAYAATLATIALLVAFARRRWGTDAGWLAGIAYATMVLPLVYARTAIFDSTLTLCTTAAILWFFEERPILAWAAMGAGVLTKAPIALAIPLLALIPPAPRSRRARAPRDLGDRSARPPHPAPVEAAAVRATTDAGDRPRRHAQHPRERRGRGGVARLHGYRGGRRYRARRPYALATCPHRSHPGRKGGHPPDRTRAWHCAFRLGHSRRHRSAAAAAGSGGRGVCAGGDHDPARERPPARCRGGRPLGRRARPRHRRRPRPSERNGAGGARGAGGRGSRVGHTRVPAVAGVPSRTASRGPHAARGCPHQHLHPRLPGPPPGRDRLAAPAGRVLARSAVSLSSAHRIRHDRRESRRARRARGRAPADRGRRTLRSLRPLRTSRSPPLSATRRGA